MRVLAPLQGLLSALAAWSLLERHCERAHHSVGAEFAADRSIRQRPPKQYRSEPGSIRLLESRTAAFTPNYRQNRRIIRGAQGPGQIHNAGSPRERTVFGGIGRQL